MTKCASSLTAATSKAIRSLSLVAGRDIHPNTLQAIGLSQKEKGAEDSEDDCLQTYHITGRIRSPKKKKKYIQIQNKVAQNTLVLLRLKKLCSFKLNMTYAFASIVPHVQWAAECTACE